MENYQKALELLKKYKQEKILKQLEKYKSEELINQVLSINFKQIEDLKKEIGKENIKNCKILFGSVYKAG